LIQDTHVLLHVLRCFMIVLFLYLPFHTDSWYLHNDICFPRLCGLFLIHLQAMWCRKCNICCASRSRTLLFQVSKLYLIDFKLVLMRGSTSNFILTRALKFTPPRGAISIHTKIKSTSPQFTWIEMLFFGCVSLLRTTY